MMRRAQVFNCCLLFLLAATAAGVPRVRPQGQDASRPARKTYSRSATDGAISGTVSLAGEAPERRQISMDADSACVDLDPDPLTEDVIVNGGKVANVFVWIKSGDAIDEHAFELPASPAELRRDKCRYAPHVLGVRAGQTLRVVNADQTFHNLNMQPKSNKGLNTAQRPNSEPIEINFDRPEMFIPFKCNQHPWEKAYVGVFAHPFFAVTGADGSFRVEGLPPGEYTLAAWHERFGELTERVTVAPFQERFHEFTFKAEQDIRWPRKQ